MDRKTTGSCILSDPEESTSLPVAWKQTAATREVLAVVPLCPGPSVPYSHMLEYHAVIDTTSSSFLLEVYVSGQVVGSRPEVESRNPKTTESDWSVVPRITKWNWIYHLQIHLRQSSRLLGPNE